MRANERDYGRRYLTTLGGVRDGAFVLQPHAVLKLRLLLIGLAGLSAYDCGCFGLGRAQFDRTELTTSARTIWNRSIRASGRRTTDRVPNNKRVQLVANPCCLPHALAQRGRTVIIIAPIKCHDICKLKIMPNDVLIVQQANLELDAGERTNERTKSPPPNESTLACCPVGCVCVFLCKSPACTQHSAHVSVVHMIVGRLTQVVVVGIGFDRLWQHTDVFIE